MKLKNKKTGEIVDFRYLQSDHVAPLVLTTYENNKPEMYSYNSLAELNEEWEDVPTEEVWYLGERIGNYSMPKEEAEKAVEKLKAWKRLKDKGFRFDGYAVAHKSNGNLAGQIFYDAGNYCIGDVEKYLDLLFGGEE